MSFFEYLQIMNRRINLVWFVVFVSGYRSVMGLMNSQVLAMLRWWHLEFLRELSF
jgi:hypothetical protein